MFENPLGQAGLRTTKRPKFDKVLPERLGQGMCLCSCDLKILRYNPRWGKEAAHCPSCETRVVRQDLGSQLETQGPSRRGWSLASWGRAAAAEGRDRRCSPRSRPRRKCRRARPSLPRQVPLALPPPRSSPRNWAPRACWARASTPVRRGGPGSEYLAVSGNALSPSHSPALASIPALPARQQAPRGTAQVKTRLVRAQVWTGSGEADGTCPAFFQSDCIDSGVRRGRTQTPGAQHSTGEAEGVGLKPPELGGRVIRVPASCAGSVVNERW